METARRNIARMQSVADAAGCALRPHVKTHKMPLFAHMQIDAGANGITCAKIGEAEVMADGGIQDIFIAYPMVGAFRVRRSIALAKRVKRLILGVDSMACAIPLNAAAASENIVLEVRLEVDTGAKRTGVAYDKAVELAKEISTLSNLNFTGVYTFKSLMYKGQPTEDTELAAQEEGMLMRDISQAIRSAGVPVTDISAGSSPTGPAVAATGMVTEIRPGTYIFNDEMLCREHAAEPDGIAVRIFATVVSTPDESFAVLDGGTKTFPTDVPIGVAPMFYPGFAIAEGMEHLRLDRMNEEHGIIRSTNGKTGLSVGDIVPMIPIHVCTAVNMQNEVYLFDGGTLRRQKVDARGMLV